ncbi:MAG TPA: hypothetical protein VHR27_10205 [Blastocatellia bacterium]|nr:hypothetical protein [Blastocatellia bacterium]
MRFPSIKLSSTRLLTLFCVLIFSTSPALAQATSSIRGLVTDQAGEVLHNATVVVRHVDTNIERRQTG